MNSTSRPTTIRVYGSSLAGPPAAPFKRYVYNGTDRLKEKPAPLPPPKEKRTLPGKGVFKDDACGTPRGHQRHLYYNVPTCQPCRTAKTRDIARRKAEKRIAK